MLLAFPTPPSPSPPSPAISDAPVSAVSGDGHSGGATIIIIVSIIAFIIAASACIRLISRFRSLSSSNLLRTIPPPGNAADPPPSASDRDKLISSLPLFNLGSSVSAFGKSQSLDCAVCLSNFRPRDELRLLPACHHAFHSQCVDTWLRSTPSCPLCRASIELPPPSDPSRSGSFRVEIGSVSRRRPSVDGVPAGHGRAYSLGSSLEYLVEEDVEAVLECLRGPPEGKPPVNGDRLQATEVTEAAGGRGWLRDCVDRLATSASSSFNSLRFSGRIAGHLFDPPPAIAADNCRDLEASGFVEWEDTGLGGLYRWLVGV